MSIVASEHFNRSTTNATRCSRCQNYTASCFTCTCRCCSRSKRDASSSATVSLARIQNLVSKRLQVEVDGRFVSLSTDNPRKTADLFCEQHSLNWAGLQSKEKCVDLLYLQLSREKYCGENFGRKFCFSPFWCGF